MTFIAGLRLTGMTARWAPDGPMDGDALRVYVRAVLAPTLKPDNVVVPDNLSRLDLPEGNAMRASGEAPGTMALEPRWTRWRRNRGRTRSASISPAVSGSIPRSPNAAFPSASWPSA